VTRQTVAKIELSNNFDGLRRSTLKKLSTVLEAHGIEFITAADGSPGIVIRSPTKT